MKKNYPDYSDLKHFILTSDNLYVPLHHFFIPRPDIEMPVGYHCEKCGRGNGRLWVTTTQYLPAELHHLRCSKHVQITWSNYLVPALIDFLSPKHDTYVFGLGTRRDTPEFIIEYWNILPQAHYKHWDDEK